MQKAMSRKMYGGLNTACDTTRIHKERQKKLMGTFFGTKSRPAGLHSKAARRHFREIARIIAAKYFIAGERVRC